MFENFEDTYSDKLLKLAEYLELEETQLEDIIEEDNSCDFSYDGEDYLVLTSNEVDDYVNDLADDQIAFYNDMLRHDSRFEYTQYLKVDEDAVREGYDLSCIGVGEWNEIDDYYIFKM